MSLFAKQLAQQAGKPSLGFWGFVVKLAMNQNIPLVQATFDRLEAKENDSVLEVGFGYGDGLSYALDSVLGKGTGKLYGVDHAETACDAVKKRLKKAVEREKLEIFNTDVTKIPLDDNVVDKAFHVNCFYFWPDPLSATIELKRVMKPGAKIITGINIKKMMAWNVIKSHQFQPKKYVDALQGAGFEDIKEEVVQCQSRNAEFTFVHAFKPCV